MRKGYWTKGGHFIVAHRIDADNVYALDPGSKVRTQQSIPQFIRECKRMFAYWPQERRTLT